MNSRHLNYAGHGSSIPETASALSVSSQLLGLVCWLLVTFAAAGIGSVATLNAQGFYEQLARPEWAPPANIFGPVWGVLYLFMGVAAWLVWRKGGFQKAGMALELYVIQLVLNALWSWLFFAWHSGGWATVEIMILWTMIFGTLISFWRVSVWPGLLFVPYLAWVTFATALCLSTWRMNPTILGG